MSPKVTNFTSTFSLQANGKTLSLAKPVIMGIVNLTPDSFFDGGTLSSQNEILQRAETYINEGAHILDLGAVSTKPNAALVDEEEELRRLLPTLKLLRNTFPEIFISVDTYRSAVALAAAEEGADIINDISGGTFDAKMFDVVAETKLPYIIMHIQGTPQNMQHKPHYNDVAKEVYAFLSQQKQQAINAGIKQVVLDIGFGFGKTTEHNYTLLKHLLAFEALDCPLLVGVSRKSMIYKTLNTTVENALNGTTALHTIALLNGANIIRVHDVKEAAEAIQLVNCYHSV